MPFFRQKWHKDSYTAGGVLGSTSGDEDVCWLQEYIKENSTEHNNNLKYFIFIVLFLSELIVQEGLDLVGAELYGELEDDEEEQGLQCPVKGDKTLLETVEPALAEAMH